MKVPHKSDNVIEPISWDDFRESGFLWLINRFLHVFGLVIVVEVDEEGGSLRAYPARTKFRGFSYDDEDEGFKKVSEYMVDNATELKAEVEAQVEDNDAD